MVIKEFECDCCGIVLTKEQMKIEKKLNVDLSPCYCKEIVMIDKLKKQIKKLKESNSDYFGFLMDHDDMLYAFDEWKKEQEEEDE